MSETKPSKKSSVGKIVFLVVSMFLMLGLAWLFTHDPRSNAHNGLEATLYESVAYDVAAIQNSVSNNTTSDELIEAIANHPYLDNYLTAGTATENSVLWASGISRQITYQDWFSNNTLRLMACVRYEAFLEQKTVRVTPIACNEIPSLPDNVYGEEIMLDPMQIQQARDDRNNQLDCQPLGEGRVVCK
jgi:hypothetical protein